MPEIETLEQTGTKFGTINYVNQIWNTYLLSETRLGLYVRPVDIFLAKL